jgi:hypothetical protein
MGRKLVALAAGVAGLALLPAGASAATIILDPGANGVLSGTFGNTVNTVGSFQDIYTFDLPTAGTTSGTISTVSLSEMNNIDFASVLLNSTPFTLTNGTGEPLTPGNRTVEFGSLVGLPTVAGTQTLTVNGVSGGNGSYSGTVSFNPNVAAVPEPATWALMLFGFGFLGAAMRRRSKKTNVTARIRFA